MPGPIDWLMNLRYGNKNAGGQRGPGQDIQLPNESGVVDPRLAQAAAASQPAMQQPAPAVDALINQLQRRNQILGAGR